MSSFQTSVVLRIRYTAQIRADLLSLQLLLRGQHQMDVPNSHIAPWFDKSDTCNYKRARQR